MKIPLCEIGAPERQCGSMTDSRIVGSVKWFNTIKGYGFLTVEGRDKDIFVHRQQLNRSGLEDLLEGDKVTFVLESGRKGDYATQISKAQS